MFLSPGPSLRMRRWISGALLVAMLFMQFATAAYACPQVMMPPQPVAASMAGMPDCHQQASSQHDEGSALCKAHCSKDGQSAASTAAPDLQPNPAAPTLFFGIVEPTPCVAALPARLAGMAPAFAQARGAPPLYLSLLVLRN